MDGELLAITALDEFAGCFRAMVVGRIVVVRIGILKGGPATSPDGDLNTCDSVNDSHCRRILAQGLGYGIRVEVDV